MSKLIIKMEIGPQIGRFNILTKIENFCYIPLRFSDILIITVVSNQVETPSTQI